MQDEYLYQRVWANSTTSKGWAAVMWNSTNGMAYGQSTILTVPEEYAPAAFDGYNLKKGKPMNLSEQSVAPQNVSGGATSTGLDVSFVRLLDTGLSQHYAIPAAGTNSTMSVAWQTSFFDFHGKNAYFIESIDVVGVATGNTQQPKLVEAVTRRSGLASMLSAFMTPQ